MAEQALSPAPSRFATRSMIWLYTLITVVLAPLLNFGIALATNLDLASFTLYMFIPIGTFALCALACSGFLLGAVRTIYHPDTIDLVFLMLASIAAIVLGFVFEYVYLMVATTRRPRSSALSGGSFSRASRRPKLRHTLVNSRPLPPRELATSEYSSWSCESRAPPRSRRPCIRRW